MWWTEADGRVFAKKLGLGCKGREGSQLLYVPRYFLKDPRNNPASEHQAEKRGHRRPGPNSPTQEKAKVAPLPSL